MSTLAPAWQLSRPELLAIANKAQGQSKRPAPRAPEQQPATAPADSPQPSPEPDDAFALASQYAQTWNDFTAAGMPPSDQEIAEADAELEGSAWCIQQDDEGQWTVKPKTKPSAPMQFGRNMHAEASLSLPSELLDLKTVRQQDDYSCGAACAATVGHYWKVGPQSLDEWKKELGTNVKKSTRPPAIVEKFRALGCEVEDRDHLTIADLQDYWRRGWPVICCIQEYGLPSKEASFKYGHYVVCIGAALGQVFVADPSIDNVLKRPGGDVPVGSEDEDADQAPGRMMIDQKTWMAVWHDRDADGKKYIRYGIAVGPPSGTGNMRFARTDWVLQFAAMRAPYGTRAQPFSVGSKPYLKGQFIPGEVVKGLKDAAASGNAMARQQVADLEKAAAGHEATRQKNAQTRRGRDLSKLKGRLETHAQSQPLDVAGERGAARSYRALQRYHGDLTLHRLDELSEQVETRLNKVDKDLSRLAEGDPNFGRLQEVRQRLQGQLARYHRVHQLAEAEGGAKPQQEQQPVTPPQPGQRQAVAVAEKEPAKEAPSSPANVNALSQKERTATEKNTSNVEPDNGKEDDSPLLPHMSDEYSLPLKRIAKDAGLSREDAIKEISKLVKQGRVEVETTAGGGRYRLVPSDDPYADLTDAPPTPPAEANENNAAAPPAVSAEPSASGWKSRSLNLLKQRAQALKSEKKKKAQEKIFGKLSADPKEMRKKYEDYEQTPERLDDFKALAKMYDKQGKKAEAEKYRQRATDLEKRLREAGRLADEYDYNPGVHQRSQSSNSGTEQLAQRIADEREGKTQERKNAPVAERPILLDNLSPAARQVVADEQKGEKDKERSKGRPAKNKILKAAQTLSEIRQQLSHPPSRLAPALDAPPESEPEVKNPEPITLRQRMQDFASQIEEAIAHRDLAKLKKLRFARDKMEMMLRFVRMGEAEPENSQQFMRSAWAIFA